MNSLQHMEPPSYVLDSVEEYRQKVMQHFDLYRDQLIKTAGEPNDETIPGISPNFILKHDRTKLSFNGATLTKGIYSYLYRMCKPGKTINEALAIWVEETFPGCYLQNISGFFFYPRDNGFMGWHTNSDTPGLRVYLTHSAETNKSFFRYYDNDTCKVKTDWDQYGWNIRCFEITDLSKGPYFWHCVWSNTERLSVGLRIRQK